MLKRIGSVEKKCRWKYRKGCRRETTKLNDTQKRIISLIQSNKDITQAEISEQLNVTTRTVERNMKKLQENNIINRVGSYTQGYWEIVKQL